MKEFIFDENQACINPNRREGGNKDFWFEIQTACHHGKWFAGHQFWSRTWKMDLHVYLNTTEYDTEQEAAYKEIGHLLKFLEYENNKTIRPHEVPAVVFRELKNMKQKEISPQLFK